MKKVSGTLRIGTEVFEGPERIIQSESDVWRLVKEFEGTLLAQLGIDPYVYEMTCNPQYMTIPEAAQVWGIKRNTLVAAVTRGRFDGVGGVRTVKPDRGRTIHYISEKAMYALFGEPRRAAANGN